MGEADQFIKKQFRLETAEATRHAVTFDSAPEVATASLTPDGLLTTVGMLPPGEAVAAPWTLLPQRAVVDFKMEGDHVDRAALARAELRRMAAWTLHLEEEDRGASPGRYATLLVAPHLPDWLRKANDPTALAVTLAAEGCYRLAPRDHVALWIASNELPLHPSLVPFLWVRSGRALVKFVRWLALQRGVTAVATVIRSHPMSAQIAQQIVDTPSETEAERLRGLEMARVLVGGFPEVANEIRDEGRLETLMHMAARKLRRPLTERESATLAERFRSLGQARLEHVVLDFEAAALAAWLSEPSAT